MKAPASPYSSQGNFGTMWKVAWPAWKARPGARLARAAEGQGFHSGAFSEISTGLTLRLPGNLHGESSGGWPARPGCRGCKSSWVGGGLRHYFLFAIAFIKCQNMKVCA